MSAAECLGDDELLWRRVHPTHITNGRVSSAAFTGREMSVDVARIQVEMSRTLKEGSGIAELPTGAARSLNQQVVSQPEEDNSAHAIVRGEKPKSVQRKLKKASRFVSRNEIRSQN